MPRWLGRLIYCFRGKRRVRIHCERIPAENVGSDFTVEGVLIGRWAGQHVLIMAKMLEGEDSTVPLDGYVEIPSVRVLFTQVLDG